MNTDEDLIITLMAQIDRLIAEQVKAIEQHSAYQQLQASWLSVADLLIQTNKAERRSNPIKIKLLDVKFSELKQDMQNASEFDQSLLFKQIYTDEFDQPGGEPFGLLIADYYINHQQAETVFLLRHLAQVAEAAFAPCIIGVAPSLFGLDSFAELQASVDINEIFNLTEYQRFRSLRQKSYAKFLVLSLPRVRLREQPLLWGNSCYAYALTLINVYQKHAWFIDMLTASDNSLPELMGEVLLTDAQLQQLAQAGLQGIKTYPYQQKSVWQYAHSLQSLPSTKVLNKKVSAIINTRIDFVLSAARFIHHLKVMLRDKIGSAENLALLESELQEWLLSYCRANQNRQQPLSQRKPLLDARLRLQALPYGHMAYQCHLEIKPFSEIVGDYERISWQA